MSVYGELSTKWTICQPIIALDMPVYGEVSTRWAIHQPMIALGVSAFGELQVDISPFPNHVFVIRY